MLRITKTLQAGESFTISTVYGSKRVIYRHADGVEENGFRYLSPDSDMNMQLQPGVNTFRYDAADNREGLRVIRIRDSAGCLHGRTAGADSHKSRLRCQPSSEGF